MTNDFGGVTMKEAANNAIKVLRQTHPCRYGCTWDHFENLELLCDELHDSDWEDMLTWMNRQLDKQEISINHILKNSICSDITVIQTFLKKKAKSNERI